MRAGPHESTITRPIRVFVAYAREDEVHRDQMLKTLRDWERQGRIVVWADHRVVAGEPWDEAIRSKLAAADLFLFLMSRDSIASEYIDGVEIRSALERHRKGEAHVFPVIVRRCDWQDTRLGALQAVPRSTKPVAEYKDPDDFWHEVRQELKTVIERMDRKVRPPKARTEDAAAPQAVGARRGIRARIKLVVAGLVIIAVAAWVQSRYMTSGSGIKSSSQSLEKPGGKATVASTVVGSPGTVVAPVQGPATDANSVTPEQEPAKGDAAGAQSAVLIPPAPVSQPERVDHANPIHGSGRAKSQSTKALARTSQKAQVVKPAPPQVAAGPFVVPVSAFANRDGAEELAALLKGKDFPAAVVVQTTDALYHVQVGPYPVQADAETAKKSLEEEGFKPSTPSVNKGREVRKLGFFSRLFGSTTIELQVSAHRSREEAEPVFLLLKRKNFPAAIVNRTTDTLFHVTVGPYHTLTEAEAAKKSLEEEGFKPILLK
jgi:cell division protein FtsN